MHDHLGRAFLHHDREIGVKMSAALQLWFEQTYVPLSERVAALENVWYRRWPRAVRARIALMLEYVRAFFASAEVPGEEPATPDEVPPVPEADAPAGA